MGLLPLRLPTPLGVEFGQEPVPEWPPVSHPPSVATIVEYDALLAIEDYTSSATVVEATSDADIGDTDYTATIVELVTSGTIKEPSYTADIEEPETTATLSGG